MDGGCVWLELHDLLLLSIHEPPLAVRFDGTVLVTGAFLKHFDNPTETPLSPAVEAAVSRLALAIIDCLVVEAERFHANTDDLEA